MEDARDYFDNRRPDGEVYGQMLEFGDHDKRQAELEQRIDWLENNVMLVTELLRAGLYMNRILRIYHNGCLRGGAPLGEELGRAQGAASQRPPPNPTGFVPSKGDRRFKEPLTRQGLNALYRHVDRVREALDGIPAIFKDCFDSNLELDFRGARVQQTLHEWIREIMLRHRGNAFWSGFEVLSALDLQTIDRVCRFADTRWQTPVNIGKEPVVDEDVWEV